MKEGNARITANKASDRVSRFSWVALESAPLDRPQ